MINSHDNAFSDKNFKTIAKISHLLGEVHNEFLAFWTDPLRRYLLIVNFQLKML